MVYYAYVTIEFKDKSLKQVYEQIIEQLKLLGLSCDQKHLSKRLQKANRLEEIDSSIPLHLGWGITSGCLIVLDVDTDLVHVVESENEFDSDDYLPITDNIMLDNGRIYRE